MEPVDGLVVIIMGDSLTESGQVLIIITPGSIMIYKYIMSLPQQLAAKIKSIPMDPLALANNVELAYMLSFSNHSTSLLT